MPDTRQEPVCRINFSQYDSGPFTHHTVDDLIAIQNETGGGLVARVENSGSEGWYVEVARWSPPRHRWERFCFHKFLGGEIDELDGRQCAELIRGKINDGYYPGEDACFVRDLPPWTGDDPCAALMEVAVEQRRGLYRAKIRTSAKLLWTSGEYPNANEALAAAGRVLAGVSLGFIDAANHHWTIDNENTRQAERSVR